MQPLIHWFNDFKLLVPYIALGLLILVIAVLLSAPLARLMSMPINRMSKSQLINIVVRRTLRILIILFGVYLFLHLAGLTSFAVAILSGTGVVGLILGFAFRDIAENFISSLLLSVQRPFKIGDVIEVEGAFGVIKQVTARATTLVDFDGNHIQIPNATIYKNVIKNFSANPNMRGHIVVGVGYENDTAQAQQIALRILKRLEMVLDDPEPQVLVDSLGSATINLKMYFWIDATRYSIFKVSSILMRTVTDTYEQAGISMPDDARERIFPQGLTVLTDKSEGNLQETPHSDPVAAQTSPASLDEHIAALRDEDVSSDVEEIKQQAAEARDPEQGDNIL